MKIIRSKRVTQFIVHLPNRSLIARTVLIGQCSLQMKQKEMGSYSYSVKICLLLYLSSTRAQSEDWFNLDIFCSLILDDCVASYIARLAAANCPSVNT